MRAGFEGSAKRRGGGGRLLVVALVAVGLLAILPGCRSPAKPPTPLDRYPRPTVKSGGELRQGQEIVVAGRLFPVETRVVLWSDPGGYDAYNPGLHFGREVEVRAEADEEDLSVDSEFPRYDDRAPELVLAEGTPMPETAEDLARVQELVDQFVIHYDACGTSRRCFEVLHDERGLSCHFLLDLDGTVYQTLDLRERAWHATIANSRSVGIEIAHVGAYRADRPSPLEDWYVPDASGAPRIALPVAWGDPGFQRVGFVPRASRPEPVVGLIQGRELKQYDFTAEQYEALIRLTAGLCRIFPKLRCDYPRDQHGNLIRTALSCGEFDGYAGLLGHFHVQMNKVDPGPAFQWDLVVNGARHRLEGTPPGPGNDRPLAGSSVPPSASSASGRSREGAGRGGGGNEAAPVPPPSGP